MLDAYERQRGRGDLWQRFSIAKENSAAKLTPSVQSRQCSQVLQPLEGSRGPATACTQEGEQSDSPTDQNTDPRHALLGELGKEPGRLVLQR